MLLVSKGSRQAMLQECWPAAGGWHAKLAPLHVIILERLGDIGLGGRKLSAGVLCQHRRQHCASIVGQCSFAAAPRVWRNALWNATTVVIRGCRCCHSSMSSLLSRTPAALCFVPTYGRLLQVCLPCRRCCWPNLLNGCNGGGCRHSLQALTGLCGVLVHRA